MVVVVFASAAVLLNEAQRLEPYAGRDWLRWDLSRTHPAVRPARQPERLRAAGQLSGGQSTTQLNIAFVKKLGAGFFGGEGFILEKLTGPGTVFIHAGGDFIEFTLAAGESLQVDTGCIVAFDEGVDYDIQFVGGIKTALFGGEGFFLATLTGPGRVLIQSMTLEKMRREIAPYRTGGDEHRGLGAISGIFDSDD